MTAAQDPRSREDREGRAADAGEAADAARPLAGEFAFAIALVLLVVSVLVQALELPFFQPDGSIGSAFFPVSISLFVLALLGGYLVFLVVSMARSRPRRAATVPAYDQVAIRDQLVLSGLIVFTVLVGDRIGLSAAIGILLLTGLLSIERVGLRASLLFTLGTLVSVYLIFGLWLGMDVGLRGLL